MDSSDVRVAQTPAFLTATVCSALSVVALSVDWFAADTKNDALLAGFYGWKANPPIFGAIYMFLMLLLPLAFFGMVKDQVIGFIKSCQAGKPTMSKLWGSVNFCEYLIPTR